MFVMFVSLLRGVQQMIIGGERFRTRNRPAHNYMRSVLALVGTLAGTLEPGTVTIIRVEHDDSCGIWQGRSCDCSPIVTAEDPAERERM